MQSGRPKKDPFLQRGTAHCHISRCKQSQTFAQSEKYVLLFSAIIFRPGHSQYTVKTGLHISPRGDLRGGRSTRSSKGGAMGEQYTSGYLLPVEPQRYLGGADTIDYCS